MKGLGNSRSSRLRDRLVFQRGEQTLKNPPPVVAAQHEFAGTLRMRPPPCHVSPLVADAGDVLQRAVWIRRVGYVSARVAVLPKDLVAGLELCQRFVVGKVAALAVRNGHAEEFFRGNLVRER